MVEIVYFHQTFGTFEPISEAMDDTPQEVYAVSMETFQRAMCKLCAFSDIVYREGHIVMKNCIFIFECIFD